MKIIDGQIYRLLAITTISYKVRKRVYLQIRAQICGKLSDQVCDQVRDQFHGETV